MDAILLGTGDAVGMPAPYCSCEYCAITTRTRPSLYINTTDHSVLFDASPDVTAQFAQSNVFDPIDSVFLTHHHHDHSTGLMDLHHTTLSKNRIMLDAENMPESDSHSNLLDCYASPDVHSIQQSELEYLYEDDASGLEMKTISHGETVTIGSLDITGIRSDHCEGYLGYLIEQGSTRLLYSPDFGIFDWDMRSEQLSTAIVDGSSKLGYHIHGTKSEFERVYSKLDPEEFVFVNVSEHLAEASTEELRATLEDNEIIPDDGYRVL